MEDLAFTPMQWPSNGQASDVATHGYQISWSLELWSSLVQGSVQIQMDQIDLGCEHLSNNYDRIKTEGLFPSFLDCINPGRGRALYPLPCPMCLQLDFLLADPMEEGMATHSSVLAWRIPMDRGARWATVHRAAKSQTWLRQSSMHTC